MPLRGLTSLLRLPEELDVLELFFSSSIPLGLITMGWRWDGVIGGGGGGGNGTFLPPLSENFDIFPFVSVTLTLSSFISAASFDVISVSSIRLVDLSRPFLSAESETSLCLFLNLSLELLLSVLWLLSALPPFR